MPFIVNILIIFLASCTIFPDNKNTVETSESRPKLNQILEESFDYLKVPGICVGLWTKGREVFSGCKGKSKIDSDLDMDSQNYIRIGSITKTFTATLMMILSEKKYFSLDDPISKFGYAEAPKPEITLRQLASMQSGLANYSFDKSFQEDLFTNPDKRWDIHNLIDLGFKNTLKGCPNAPSSCFPPGTRFAYCNTNYAMIAVIMEKVTQMSYKDLLEKFIFTPLNLHKTHVPSGRHLPEPYTHGYTLQGTKNKEARDATHSNPAWGLGTGNLISTIGDLKIWAQALVRGSLISDESKKAMFDYHQVPPNKPEHFYALGVGFKNGWWGHAGSIPGYNTQIFYHPGLDSTIVVSVNHDDVDIDGSLMSPAQWIAGKFIDSGFAN